MKDLEFLPQHHIRARQNQRLRLTRLWLLVVLAVSMACWTLYSRARIHLAEDSLAATENTVADMQNQVNMVTGLRQQEATHKAQEALVNQLTVGRPRTELLRELSRCLPDEVVLTRVEMERQEREVQDRLAMPAPTTRRGVAAKPKTEVVDRIRVEGFSLDDISMTRFVQDSSENGVFQKGEVGYTKDAVFRQKDVRVFTATFYVPVPQAGADKAKTAAQGVAR
jgi:hypothetical protein